MNQKHRYKHKYKNYPQNPEDVVWEYEFETDYCGVSFVIKKYVSTITEGFRTITLTKYYQNDWFSVWGKRN